jgi:L-fucose mutarotase
MLKQRLLHPEILEALAAAGHGARVLITDGNYPASTRLGENAALVYLNLSPGLVRVTDVLSALMTAIPIEEAAVMEPDEGPEPPVYSEFERMLDGFPLSRFGRFEFYEEASGPDTCLQIVTGDQRLYANLLLTIGVAEMNG